MLFTFNKTLPMKERSDFYPHHLLIETTTRCNLRCKQCARLADKYALADLEMEMFSRLSPLFPHVREVALYGHGETFLHKQFFTMLEELKKHNIFVYITTNGTLLTEDVAERLVALKLDRLSFSLDAATPELFNHIRQGADLDTIITNIRRLNSIKKRVHRDDAPVLSIMYCAMKSNLQELPKLVRLADQLNMTHGIAVIHLVDHGQSAEECLDQSPESVKRYFHEAHELAEKLAIPLDIAGGFGIQFPPVRMNLWERIARNYREFQRSFNRTTLLKTKLSRASGRMKQKSASPHLVPENVGPSETIRVKDCRDPWEFMFVNVHGDIRVCCISHRIMGNINHDTVENIWENPSYQEFRRRMLTAEPPEECQTCPMRGWREIPA
jgi:radical SAM protein with 4Fe4S-binding SPASM domain